MHTTIVRKIMLVLDLGENLLKAWRQLFKQQTTKRVVRFERKRKHRSQDKENAHHFNLNSRILEHLFMKMGILATWTKMSRWLKCLVVVRVKYQRRSTNRKGHSKHEENLELLYPTKITSKPHYIMKWQHILDTRWHAKVFLLVSNKDRTAIIVALKCKHTSDVTSQNLPLVHFSIPA